MIVGLGVELVDVARFRAAAARFGSSFRERLFTQGERTHAAGRVREAETLAVRFAAKLAARRALGGLACSWHDVEVVGERGRTPRLAFRGAALQAARRLGVSRVNLSLAHEQLWALGQVVLETAPGAEGDRQ